jgi:hypothetical protein
MSKDKLLKAAREHAEAVYHIALARLQEQRERNQEGKNK